MREKSKATTTYLPTFPQAHRGKDYLELSPRRSSLNLTLKIVTQSNTILHITC